VKESVGSRHGRLRQEAPARAQGRCEPVDLRLLRLRHDPIAPNAGAGAARGDRQQAATREDVPMTSRRGASAAALVLVASMASGGCVAAAPLISAAVSAAPLIGGRTVEPTGAADRPVTRQAGGAAPPRPALRIEPRDQG